MIANKWKKTIKSLHSKKHRVKEGLFLVEGFKAVQELLKSDFEVEYVCCSIEKKDLFETGEELVVTESKEINSVASLTMNNDALAVVKVPSKVFDVDFISGQYLTLALDNIQDPGNLGTIIRLADWYGIKNIICSNNCVDFYNPKTINATMGSFCRVQPIYVDLLATIKHLQLDKYMIYATDMEGTSVYDISKKSSKNIVVLGNEANGVSQEVMSIVGDKLTIPRIGDAESLNVAMATGIICDNFNRVR